MKKLNSIKPFCLLVSGAMVISLMVLPTTVHAVGETAAAAPEYRADAVGKLQGYKGEFFANGVPITISTTEESGKSALITWDGGEQLIDSDDMIFGGSDSTASDVELASTSITVNDGTVKFITAGNKTTNETSCKKSKVGTATVDINGGTIAGVFGTDNQNSVFGPNVATSTEELYKNYSIDKLEVTIDGATVNDFRGVTSYTYANKMNVTVGKDKAAVLKEQTWGTNGFIDEATFTMYSGKTTVGKSNLRAVIGKMTYNILGGEVGDIYAGSYYPANETYDGYWKNEKNVGGVDYGFANAIKINIAKNAKYNDIISGFQFRPTEVAAFKTKYGTGEEWRIKGLNENAELVLNLSTEASATTLDAHSVIGKEIATTNWVTTDITLNETAKTLKAGGTFELTAVVLPSEAPAATFTSSDAKVATVDKDGKVTAISAGTAVISAKSGSIVTKCTVTIDAVTVEKPPEFDTSKPVEDVTPTVPAETVVSISKETSLVLADIISGKGTNQVSAQTKENVEKAIKEGSHITSAVNVAIVKESAIAKTDIAKIKAVLTNNAIISEYLDFSVMLKAGGNELGTINQFTNKLTFSVAIPQNLKLENREFYVVRLHDGVAEKLVSTLNSDGTISFETDKLSTYALVYEDIETPDKEENVTPPVDNTGTPPSITPDDKTEIPSITPTDKTETTNKGVSTGDTTNITLYSTLMLSGLSLMGILWAANKRKKLINK